MAASVLYRHGGRLGALLGVALGLALCAGVPPAGAAGVSGNWAGYVAVPHAGARSSFSSVSGSWRQPAATCRAGRESFSAVWVGLGGYGAGAHALEQIGTDANCSASGRAAYAAWFELLPADPVAVKLRVTPGDRIAASVTVKGSRVTLRIRNLTSGARFSATRHYSRPDRSSAEWIVEAPSRCASANDCTTLPLANFATVPFSSATASAHGRTGPVLAPAWSTSALELRQDSTGAAGRRHGVGVSVTGAVVRATPSAVSRSDGSFSVTWSEGLQPGEPPSAPTLPGGAP